VKLGWLLRLLGLRRATDVLRGTQLVYVGLGNPGDKYRNTRHNIGYRVLDSLSALSEEDGHDETCSALVTACRIAEKGTRVALVKPVTFMNRSGDSVCQVLATANLPPTSCLVVADDLNLPIGKLRFRKSGSDGGHNGLKSIITRIGDQFPRLRVGIGPVPKNATVVDFVLSDFGNDESALVHDAISRAVEALVHYAENGMDSAMSKYN
jgi:peptidyl-tRNA hydrolase, PTH1 family